MTEKGSDRATQQSECQQKHMTFGEFVAWYRKRQRIRKQRMSAEMSRKMRRRTILLAAVLAVIFCAVTVAVICSRLHQRDQAPAVPLSVSTAVSDAVMHPSHAAEAISCSVVLSIGNNEPLFLDTTALTVADFIETLSGYEMGSDDILDPPAETVIEDGMQINIIEVTFEDDVEVISIPYETEYVDSQTIPKGTTERITYGEAGVACRNLRNRYENGILVSTEEISTETITEPVNEKLYRGVGGIVRGKDGVFAYSYYIEVTATAYGDYDEPRLTYTGTLAQEGVIAVDPHYIPLGTKVYVKGEYGDYYGNGDYGYCSADDIGGGIKGYHIDIFMETTREEMLKFGIRKMRVYIIEEPE